LKAVKRSFAADYSLLSALQLDFGVFLLVMSAYPISNCRIRKQELFNLIEENTE
jgi:hypothetical protein